MQNKLTPKSIASELKIIPIPAFKDNYIWLLHDDSKAIVVDPGDANVVLHSLKQLGLSLHSILITHHHSDHIDGVADLMQAYPKATVYAPKLECYAFEHIAVSEPEHVILPEFGLDFSVIDLPGHTLGHIAYYTNSDETNTPLVFCGDTLFGAGCGRLFEGTPAQMFASLQKLAALPANTAVYCTHEYTLHNIAFALTLEPNNQALIERNQKTTALRNLGLPSLPSNMALELATNPFLRSHSAEIQTNMQLKNATLIEVFTAARALRNHH